MEEKQQTEEKGIVKSPEKFSDRILGHIDEEKLLTIRELCDEITKTLSIKDPYQWVYARIQNKKIRAIKLTNQYFIQCKDAKNFLDTAVVTTAD